jgi:hypothetical protein
MSSAWYSGMRVGDATGDGNLNAVDITKVERIVAHWIPLISGPMPIATVYQFADITKVERVIRDS